MTKPQVNGKVVWTTKTNPKVVYKCRTDIVASKPVQYEYHLPGTLTRASTKDWILSNNDPTIFEWTNQKDLPKKQFSRKPFTIFGNVFNERARKTSTERLISESTTTK